jgi:surface antigen
MTNFRKGLVKGTETVSWNGALEFAEIKWTGADGTVFGIFMCKAAVNYNWIGCQFCWRYRYLWKANTR